MQTCCGDVVNLATTADRRRMCEVHASMGPIGPSGRLTGEQVQKVKQGLIDEFGENFAMNTDVLSAAKLSVCRFLRPSEMKAVFGDAPILRRRIAVQGANGSGLGDPRVLHMIGRQGNTIQHLTRASGCFYMWIKPYRGQLALIAYAKDAGALAKAAKLTNEHAAKWRPRSAAEPMAPLTVRLINKPGFTPATIDIKKMYTEAVGLQ
jgi:hypothetical protein